MNTTQTVPVSFESRQTTDVEQINWSTYKLAAVMSHFTLGFEEYQAWVLAEESKRGLGL